MINSLELFIGITLASTKVISIRSEAKTYFMRVVKCTNTIVLVFIFAICSCGNKQDQNPQDLSEVIVNTWKLSEFSPAAKFPMSDSIKQVIIAKTLVEFTADKKFKQTGIGKTHTGTYSISADGKQIIYYHEQKDITFTETILEFASNRMSVVDQNGNKMTRVPVKR